MALQPLPHRVLQQHLGEGGTSQGSVREGKPLEIPLRHRFELTPSGSWLTILSSFCMLSLYPMLELEVQRADHEEGKLAVN